MNDTALCLICHRPDGSLIMTTLVGRCPQCGGEGIVPVCIPPDGTDDFTMHWLSCEVGDGSQRRNFQALWIGGMWKTKTVCPLSPRKAAYTTWEYVRPVL